MAAERIDEAFLSSMALKIITDLSNLDKHGPERNGGFSKQSPRLRNITRALQIQGAGSSFMFSLKDGSFKTSGNLGLVISAEVIHGNVKVIGEISKLADEAIGVWEGLIRDRNT